MLNFARQLTPGSAMRYALWRARGRQGPTVLTSRLGPRFELRPTRFGELGNNDYGVAYEVFVMDLYQPTISRLAISDIHFIVDLGANVGYSALRLLHAFPQATALAFEPHPGHAAQARKNWALSGVDQRVKLVQAGAGAHARRAVISDRGSGSTVDAADAALSIEIVDVFAILGTQRIDLLKIDIEGGEYEILRDPRFATLNVGAIVMEWHDRGDGRNFAYCQERLQSLGFVTQAYADQGQSGMLLAIRGQASA